MNEKSGNSSARKSKNITLYQFDCYIQKLFLSVWTVILKGYVQLKYP